jgi:hypothetical protein
MQLILTFLFVCSGETGTGKGKGKKVLDDSNSHDMQTASSTQSCCEAIIQSAQKVVLTKHEVRSQQLAQNDPHKLQHHVGCPLHTMALSNLHQPASFFLRSCLCKLTWKSNVIRA